MKTDIVSPCGTPVTRRNKKGYYELSWMVEKQKCARILEHRYVWQCHNGPIPANHVIHHIDGNIWNNDIDNLQCVTRAAHRRLHRTYASVADRTQAKLARRKLWYQERLDHVREQGRRYAAKRMARLLLPENAEARERGLKLRRERARQVRRQNGQSVRITAESPTS